QRPPSPQDDNCWEMARTLSRKVRLVLAPNGFSVVLREQSPATLWARLPAFRAISSRGPAKACRRTLYGNRPKNRLVLGSVCKLNGRTLHSVGVEALQGLVDDGDQPQGDLVDRELLVACAKGTILLVPVDDSLGGRRVDVRPSRDGVA